MRIFAWIVAIVFHVAVLFRGTVPFSAEPRVASSAQVIVHLIDQFPVMVMHVIASDPHVLDVQRNRTIKMPMKKSSRSPTTTSISGNELAASLPTVAVPTSTGEPSSKGLPMDLFNIDGSLKLGKPLMFDANSSTDVKSEILRRGHNLLRCKHTGLSGSYKHDETLGDKVAREYLSHIGLYNPHTQAQLELREAAAAAACDE